MSDPPRANASASLIPGPTLDSPAADYLRTEQVGFAAGATKAVLLHELGVLEERAGDEMSAAREYLASFNCYPQFREPLEGLVRLLERRKSVKNLPKLLDALLRAAETPEERSRALRKRAAFHDDVKGDVQTARESLEQAAEEEPNDPATWLALEILGAKTADADLRSRALEQRARISTDPHWRSLLLLALADIEANRGQVEAALNHLAEARETEGPARWRALLDLEQLLARERRDAALAQALESQADLVELAMGDGDQGDRFGVPRSQRSPGVAADALLRAAEARRREGDLPAAARLLDRALAIAGLLPSLVGARLSVAEANGDADSAEKMAEALLSHDSSPKTRASLWMRVAEAAANREDVQGALRALNEALKADPASVTARALQIDLLGRAGDPAGLASALEAMAAELPSDEAKARIYLLSAYVYALEASDVAGAKVALSQAGMAQLPATVLARVGRLLAAVTSDIPWYEDALRRLLASGISDKERLDVAFEMGRLRLLRGDSEGAGKAFDLVNGVAGGAWLGRALRAYTLGIRPPVGQAQTDAPPSEGEPRRPRLLPEALDDLRSAETDEQSARALTLAAARRADRAGDVDGARARLRTLLEANAGDLTAAAQAAEIEKRVGKPVDAAQILSAAAAASSPPELAAALHIEAGILYSRAGQRGLATSAFAAAAEGAKVAAKALQSWTLRSSMGDGPEALAARLSQAAELGDDASFLALQRLALELVGLRPDLPKVQSLLAAAEEASEGELRVTTALARTLADSEATDPTAFAQALERLEAESDKASVLVGYERLRLARRAGDHALACSMAHKLVETAASLPAALEWLGSAWAAEDRVAEAEARREVARHLTSEPQAAMEASASMVELIASPNALHAPLSSTEPAAQWMNLELTTPGGRPIQRATAFLALGEGLPDDGVRLDAAILAGYNLLAQGQHRTALECFAKAAEQRDSDLFAWEGVRSAASALGDAEREAVACSHLGELCTEPSRAAEFWETAGRLFETKLDDAGQAEICYDQAFERDPHRVMAFGRLFRRVRERNESEKLLELVARRLEVSEEPNEIAKLYWERARVLRMQGDVPGALTALENVTLIEPDHVGALALKAEMDIAQGDLASAAANLGTLAVLKQAPAQQRLMSGVAAADLYENKLNNTQKALEILTDLHQNGLSTLPVRERLARAAAKTSSWDRATEILEELMRDRPSAEGRAEAARLAMAIWRDKVDQPLMAEKAVSRLLEELPGDAEGLDFVLDFKLAQDSRRALLERGRQAIVDSLARDPTATDAISRLSRIAATLDDLPLRQATLGALKTVGVAPPEIDKELWELDARVARIPQVAVDDATLRMVADPDDTGALADLFSALAPSIAEALGPSLEALGASRKNRIDPRSGLPLRNEIASWAGALGLGEFELYVGGAEPHGAQGIPGELPAIVVGSEWAAPLPPAGRQAIVRELFALRRGTTVARTRDETTVAAIVVAACQLAGLHVESPPYAVLADVQRLLGKALSRKAKRVLPELCERVLGERQDTKTWGRAALASMYRMAAIAAGDVSLVIADALGVPLSRLPTLVPHDERARRLVAFVLSPHYLELRSRLGMGVA